LRTSKFLELQQYIASNVAAAIGQPYGVVYRLDNSARSNAAPEDWTAYRCTLLYYAYRTKLDRNSHPKVRECLEKAVASFPSYSTAWALLSLTYLDEIRMRYPPAPEAEGRSIERTLAAAKRAVALDPLSGHALEAEMLALYFSGQKDAALAVGARAIKLNPNDTNLAGEYGFRLASQGDWHSGCALLRLSRERNPAPPGYFEVALALCEYFLGNVAEAAELIGRNPIPDNHNYHLVAAAIYGEAGRKADAERERNWLTQNAAPILSRLPEEMRLRYARPEDQEKLLASLSKAGVAPDPGATIQQAKPAN
jgi:Tfp pilus assembly protein PilF